MSWSVRKIIPSDREQIIGIVQSWGADFIVSCGRKLFPQDLSGFVAVGEDDKLVGLATYEIIDKQCELVTLDALEKFSGIGTKLTESVAQAAREAGCDRLWLITTNDNLEAIRFYQRRGFVIGGVNINALAQSRQMKPAIPTTGQHGIPLRDEIIFQTIL